MEEIDERPGHRYILEKEIPNDPVDLEEYVIAYADFLRQKAGVEGEVPVPLDSILNHFRVGRQELNLHGDRQGLKFSGKQLPYQVVFVEKSDKPQRKRFSLGHELVELLFEALRQGVLATRMKEACSGFRKEQLCELGSAALLMPEEMYAERLRDRPISIETAFTLARKFDVSLLASLIRMVELAPENHLLIAWRKKLKPTQKRRHTENQLALPFEGPTGPPKKLRVEWCRWTDRLPDWHVPRNKSVPEESIVREAFQEKQQRTGVDRLNLGDSFDGTFETEVLPVQVGNDNWAISLLDVSSIR